MGRMLVVVGAALLTACGGAYVPESGDAGASAPTVIAAPAMPDAGEAGEDAKPPFVCDGSIPCECRGALWFCQGIYSGYQGEDCAKCGGCDGGVPDAR